MTQVRIWEGRRGSVGGCDDSDYIIVTFDGESLGSWTEHLDDRGNRGVTYDVYRTAEGTIIMHKVTWSRWEGESDYALVIEYDSLDDAAQYYRRELENAGIIERRVLTLDAWRALQKYRKE
jgi:surface antigen